MGYNKPNPLKMMESALKMYKAEKKGGMHRMESPMYAKEASRELKDMPIVDIEKGDAKGSPAKAYSKGAGSHNYTAGQYAAHQDQSIVKQNPKHVAAHSGSPAKLKKDSPMEKELVGKQKNLPEALKAKIEAAPESPAKMGHKDSPAKNMNKGYGQEVKSPMKRQGYNDRLDESLAKDGKESSKKQSMKDRRDESKGMKKSKGKGAYSSDPKMS